MNDYFGRTDAGELIGPYDTAGELAREILFANAELAAESIATEIIADARASGDDPIVWVTGNRYMPPLRSFDAAEAIWQADEDGTAFAILAESLEAHLDNARVSLDCPDYDNALYAVDLARFEFVESDGDNLGDDWKPI
jgi:hypothetical protein